MGVGRQTEQERGRTLEVEHIQTGAGAILDVLACLQGPLLGGGAGAGRNLPRVPTASRLVHAHAGPSVLHDARGEAVAEREMGVEGKGR